jgi:hypothetical protein
MWGLGCVGVGPAEAACHCAAEAGALRNGGPVGQELTECGRRREGGRLTGWINVIERFFVATEGSGVLG